MNKKYFLAVATATILTASIYSCKKDTPDTEKPVITLSEPMMNDTLSLSVEDSVHIEFSAIDNIELHDVAVNITNIGGTNVYTTTDDVDAKTFSYHKHFVPSGITTVTPFTLKIDASDHSGNATNQSLTFYVKP